MDGPDFSWRRGIRPWPARLTILGAVVTVQRVVLGVVLEIRSGFPVVPDEGAYRPIVTRWSEGRPIEGDFGALYDTREPFVMANGVARKLLGDARWVEVLPQAVAMAVACVLVAIVVRRLTGSERTALIAAAGLAIFPSSTYWSSLLLREAWLWLRIAVLLLGSIRLLEELDRHVVDRRALTYASVTVFVGLVLLLNLREYTFVVGLYAVVVPLVLTIRRFPIRRLVAIGALLALPLGSTMGFGSFDFAWDQWRGLDDRREALADGAESAVVEPKSDVGVVEALQIGGLRPYPWEESTGGSYTAAQFEFVLWIGLYVAALCGVVGRRRRHLLVPASFVVLFVVASGFAQGNLGTSFRHRAQLLVPLVVMASTASWRRRPRLSRSSAGT